MLVTYPEASEILSLDVSGMARKLWIKLPKTTWCPLMSKKTNTAVCRNNLDNMDVVCPVDGSKSDATLNPA